MSAQRTSRTPLLLHALLLGLASASACGDESKPAPFQGLVTATGAAGEGAAFVASDGGGQAWSASGGLTVPPGAEMLVIGSIGGAVNADLQGVTVVLRSPDGAKTIRLSGGAVVATRFDVFTPTTTPADTELAQWGEDVLLVELPPDPTDEDVMALLARFRGFDPEHPLADLPASLSPALEARLGELQGLRDSVIAGAEAATPSDGLVVFGPAAGTWTIEVEAEGGAGAFQALAWSVPSGAGGSEIAHVAEALAGATGLRTGALAIGEGEDPGGDKTLQDFMHPAPGSPEWYRAQSYWIIYKTMKFYVLRWPFTLWVGWVLSKLQNPAVIAAGLAIGDRLKDHAIWLGVMLYSVSLPLGKIERWFFRIAYTMNSVEGQFRVFYLGQIVTKSIREGYEFAFSPLVMSMDDFEEYRLIGGNMAQDPIAERKMWGFGDKDERRRLGKWTATPEGIVEVSPRGEQDGDCTVETIIGKSKPGVGELAILVTTQPAKVVVPITVSPELAIEPEKPHVDPGGSVNLEVTGVEGLEGLLFGWEILGDYGTLKDTSGHQGTSFESADAEVSYTAKADAPDGASEMVFVTVYVVEGAERTEIGHASVTVSIGGLPPCEVTLSVASGGGNPAVDVECELGEGVHVIDPESLEGCVTWRPCQGHCDSWGEAQMAGFPIGWTSYDEAGEYTGGNNCGSPGWAASTCEGQLAWNQAVCATNRNPTDGNRISACNCACGGGNCYPWRGPGKIVFRGFENDPCDTDEDIADCFYFHEPALAEGSISFRLVHCATVSNALPNCPGNVPE